MKVFISWSGELSHAVALLLRVWLQNVIQVLEPYVSSEDIEKGSRWFADIDKKLDETNYGIVCLTRENLVKPWILFEAGAISRSISRSRVTPLLINVSPADVTGPLAQFQSTTISEADILRLIKDIGGVLGDVRYTEALVERAFYKWWPDLQKDVTEAIEAAKGNQPEAEIRPDRVILEEVLQTTRTLAQLISDSRIATLFVPSSTDSVLEQIKAELDRRKKTLIAVALDEASVVDFDGDELRIEFPREVKHLRDMVTRPDNMRVLRDVGNKVMGRNIGVRVAITDSQPKAGAKSEAEHLRYLAEHDPRVRQMLRTFRAEIVDVKRPSDENPVEAEQS